jgi:hypothetical protein
MEWGAVCKYMNYLEYSYDGYHGTVNPGSEITIMGVLTDENGKPIPNQTMRYIPHLDSDIYQIPSTKTHQSGEFIFLLI